MLFALLTLSPMVQGQTTSQQDRLRDVLAALSPEEVAFRRKGNDNGYDESLLGTNPHVNPDFPNEEIMKDDYVFYVEGGDDDAAPIVSEACMAAIAEVGDDASDEELQALVEECGGVPEDSDEDNEDGEDDEDDEDGDNDDARRRRTDTSLIACYTSKGEYKANCKDKCRRRDGYCAVGLTDYGCCKSFWSCFGTRRICQRKDAWSRSGVPVYDFQKKAWSRSSIPVQVIRQDCRRWWFQTGRKFYNKGRVERGGPSFSQVCINNRIYSLLVSTKGKPYWSGGNGHCKANVW